VKRRHAWQIVRSIDTIVEEECAVSVAPMARAWQGRRLALRRRRQWQVGADGRAAALLADQRRSGVK
jgi:hypothetical protein